MKPLSIRSATTYAFAMSGVMEDSDEISRPSPPHRTEDTEHGSDSDPVDPIEPVETEEAVKLGYHPLNFNFGILKSWVLIMTMIVWLAVIGGVVTLTIIGHSEPSVLHIHSQSNYYTLRYGPSVVGTLTTIWWRAVTQSYNRIIPYIVMANVPVKPQDGMPLETIMAQPMNYLDTNSLDPSAMLQLAENKHYITLIVNLSSLALMGLVPLKSSFIQIVQDSSGWGVNVQPTIGWMIVAFYLMLLGTTLAILLRLFGKITGLKWNPCSLAAQLVLLQSSNVPIACEGLEFNNRSRLMGRIRGWGRERLSLRLGYWRNKKRPDDLFHCIRFFRYNKVAQGRDQCTQPNFPEPPRKKRNWISKFKRQPRPLFRVPLGHDTYEEHEQPLGVLLESQITRKRSARYWRQPLVKFRYLGISAIYLNDLFIFPLMLIMIACMIALAVTLRSGAIFHAHSYATFVHGTLERGLLFSFLPSFLISLASITFWQSDTYHRMLQPIRGMDKPTPARENILIDYISPNPLATIFTALSNSHYRIAWGTFTALICPLGPVIASGLFTFDDNAQTFQASPTSTYTVLAIVCLYIPALPFARIDPKYAAGRGLWNIIDTLSLCYDSPILGCPEFRAREKTEDEEIFLQCRVILAKRLYQFGYYLGSSGRRRMGFSVANVVSSQQNNSQDEMRGYRLTEEGEEIEGHETVNIVDRVKARFGFWRFNLLWFRRPQLIKSGLQRADTEMAIVEHGPESDRSPGSNASHFEDSESDAFEMTTLHQSAVGREGETADVMTETSILDEQLGEVDFAQSTAVQSDTQEVNTLLRRQFTI